jgi:hypothetical protein
MLDKLKGTAYHDAITRSLDKREALASLDPEQIKQQLQDSKSDASQVLREYRFDVDNRNDADAQDKDFSPTDENV